MAQKFNLKRLRNELGLKQSEIADVLHLPQSSVSAMENGKTEVSQQYVKQLQAHFNIRNIDEYYDEVEVVRITGNRGNNNGYKNVLTSGVDPETVSNITAIKKDVDTIKGDYEDRLKRAEKKRDELDAEIRELHRQITEFKVLCARNDLDFDYITGH